MITLRNTCKDDDHLLQKTICDHLASLLGFVSDHRVVMILWGVVGFQLGGGGVMILQVP